MFQLLVSTVPCSLDPPRGLEIHTRCFEGGVPYTLVNIPGVARLYRLHQFGCDDARKHPCCINQQNVPSTSCLLEGAK